MGDLHMTAQPGVIPGVARIIYPNPERERGPARGRSQGMADIRDLLEAVRDTESARAHFRGLLHIAIGRRVTTPAGDAVSTGVTWRELAAWLKQLRFDTDLVKQYGADPDALAPRDRNRFWYSAIAMARVDSPEAFADAEILADSLQGMGFLVAPPPAGAVPPAKSKPAAAKEKDKPAAKDKSAKSPKPKKKK